VAYDIILPVKSFCKPDDVLAPGAPLVQLNAQDTWVANGYINIDFVFFVTAKTAAEHFDMFVEKIEGNTLYVQLYHSENIEDRYEQGQGLMSFRIPSFNQLYTLYPDLNWDETIKPLVENEEPVLIKVIANGRDDKTLELEAIKAILTY
jgi:hypothetical protein